MPKLCVCGHARGQHAAVEGTRGPVCDYAGYSCACVGYRAAAPGKTRPRVARLLLFGNGMVAATDAAGEQVPAAQGRWLRKVVIDHVRRLGCDVADDVQVSMQQAEDILR